MRAQGLRIRGSGAATPSCTDWPPRWAFGTFRPVEKYKPGLLLPRKKYPPIGTVHYHLFRPCDRGFRACGGVRSLNRRGPRPLVSADSFSFLFVATGDESLALRSLNRRGPRPLVSADSFGFLIVATGDESLSPQRALRSPFGILRGLPPDKFGITYNFFD